MFEFCFSWRILVLTEHPLVHPQSSEVRILVSNTNNNIKINIPRTHRSTGSRSLLGKVSALNAAVC